MDVAARTYQGGRGWWPRRENFAGGWEDFDHLSLESVDSSEGDVWEVFLHWRGIDRKLFLVHESPRESYAREQGMAVASRLGLPLVEKEQR